MSRFVLLFVLICKVRIKYGRKREKGMEKEDLLKQLSEITEEEQDILSGHTGVDRRIYYRDTKNLSRQNEIDASLLLEKGKLIAMRPNTRFVHFPEHTHNFVEAVYMVKGHTTHIIDGHTISLGEGDLLFMNRHARQEILPAGENDIAVNFIILPQFFQYVLSGIDDTASSIRSFLTSCLTDEEVPGNYLCFHVADLLPVQNLIWNLIWLMKENTEHRRMLAQATMVLLFQHLMEATERVQMSDDSYERTITLKLLGYLESDYRTARLSEFAERIHMDIYSLERLIKRQTNRTFQELLQERRLSQACWLLEHTSMPVTDVVTSIGYENISYFYRLFKKKKKLSPAQYRKEKRQV
jgi:AraC family L-rhamnose operon regulatory protein RhaS